MVKFAAVLERFRPSRRLRPINQETDHFKLLKIVLFTGVIYWNPDRPWKRVCWFGLHLLAIVQYCILMMQAAIYLSQKNDLFFATWWFIVALGYNMCMVNFFLFLYYVSTIQQSMNFINQRSNHSDENNKYDTSVRSQFHTIVWRACVGLLFLTGCLQVLLSIPSKHRDMLFEAPQFFIMFGPKFVDFANSCIHELLASLWITRIYFYTVTFSSLLAGLRAELLIIANNYKRIMNQNQTELKIRTCGNSPCQEADELFWRTLFRDVGLLVNQHVELLRNVAIIKPALEMAFLVMYLRMIGCIGLMSFIVANTGISSASAILLPVVIGYLVECYWAGILVDSFQDINHQIMSYMSELCTILPHSKSHHTNYIEMRTSLMIIILCTSDSIRISCGGFFQMSSRVFLRVINVLYTVTTFLWQMK